MVKRTQRSLRKFVFRKSLCHETAWINLKNIMLSEWSQRQKTKYRKILLIFNSGKGKTIGIENKNSGGLRMGVWGVIDKELYRGKSFVIALQLFFVMCSWLIWGSCFISKESKDKVIDKKWLYLERNTLHRQSVTLLRRWALWNIAWLVFMGWVIS